MSVSTGHVACPSNQETAIVAASITGRAGSAARGRARTVVLYNPSAQDVWLGDGTTDATDGFLLKSGVTLTLTLGPSDAIYGQGASATPTVYFIDTSA